MKKNPSYQQNSYPVSRLVMLVSMTLLVLFVNAATDSSLNSPNKPTIIANSKCVNTELEIQDISPKVDYISWKLNHQQISVSKLPALIRTVAGTNEGTSDNAFRFPAGVTVDATGNIYVADQFNHRVQKWVPGASFGITVAGIGGQGDRADQLNYPMSVVVDKQGNIYVSDAANSRIQRFAPGSTTGVTVAGGNGRGAAANQLNMPQGICLDNAGNIYIADNYNHRIQVWSPGAKTGITVAGGSGKGNKLNQLQYPSSVQVSHDGTIYIADAANDRIVVWSKEHNKGVIVAGQEGRGKGPGQLYFPTDIALHSNGDLFIVDQTNHRILRWKPGAKTGLLVAGGNGMGSADNQLDYPYGLFVDQDDNLYVADQFNHRIQYYQNPESPVRYSFNFKAVRPGKYQTELVYRDGSIVESEIMEIHDTPDMPKITVDEKICSGTAYQLKLENTAENGYWKSNNTAIAEINNAGILMGKKEGVVDIAYIARNEFGCESQTHKTITVKATPILPPVSIAQEVVSNAGGSMIQSNEVCAGAKIPLTNMLLSGEWKTSDSSIAKIEAGFLHGTAAGKVIVSYTAQIDGCVAETNNIFTVLPVPVAPVINGYTKLVTGNRGQLSVGVQTGQWYSKDESIAAIDQHGIIKGINPGQTEIQFKTISDYGCAIHATVPLTVQPESPLVRDEIYNDSREFIRIDQQVTAKPGTVLQFYKTGDPNAQSVDPLIKNESGTHRIWVAAIQNGVASQKVSFQVKIEKGKEIGQLNPVILGNPATAFFTVQLKSTQTALPISMRVVDLSGRVIEQRQSIAANSTIQFGQQYAGGQYAVEWVQGQERKVYTLIKLGSERQMSNNAIQKIAVR